MGFFFLDPFFSEGPLMLRPLRIWHHVLGVCLASCGFSAHSADRLAAETPMPPQPSALEWVQRLRLGWNLGNTLDAFDDKSGRAKETAWGNPPADAALFEQVAQAGFRAVRIPITWLGHMGPAQDGFPVSPRQLQRVAQVVQQARQAGLAVIINVHHDGAESKHWLNLKEAARDPQREQAVRQQLVALWTQIAQHFAQHGDWLMFEPFNELHDGGWGWGDNLRDDGRQYAVLNDWTQAALDAIRATGAHNAQRLVLVSGYAADPKLTLAHLRLPRDSARDRLVVSVHYYQPIAFALQAKTSTWGIGSPHALEPGQERDVLALMEQLHSTWVARGVPVIVGEFGVVRQDGNQAWRRYYLEFVTRAMHERGLVPFMWDNGIGLAGPECFGLFDRKRLRLFDDAVALLEALNRATGQAAIAPGYGLPWLQERAPQAAPLED